MAIPFPSDDDVVLTPPTRDETERNAAGVLTAIAPPGGNTALQTLLMEASFEALTGHAVDAGRLARPGPAEFAAGLARRNLAYRTRLVHMMVLGALVLHPLPAEVSERVGAYARELGVDDGLLHVVASLADGDRRLAAMDFDRNGYTRDWSPSRAAALHASTDLAAAWSVVPDDPALAARWTALEALPPGTLGRGVVDLYRARGFAYPGLAGSAPPLLAQHDWVHVLADYGTKVEQELEVFAYIGRANDDPRGFGLLAMVVSLFETGDLASGAGLFEAFPGQLSRQGMAVRIGDALRRGALSHGLDGAPDVDFLEVDWFTLADLPIETVRERFGVPPRSLAAVEHGSVGPWQPGGISEYQLAAGQRAAAARGEPYDGTGAAP